MTLRINKTRLANQLLAAFLGLIAIGKLLQIPAFFYIGLVCAVVAVCIGDNSFRIGMCLLLVPNIRMLDGLKVSFVVNVIITLPVFAYVFETKRVNFQALSHVVILAAWDIAHVLYFNAMQNLAANLSSILVLYYVECVLIDKRVHTNFPDIVRKFSFGCIFSAVMHYITLALYTSPQSAWEYVMAWRLQGFAGDPNYYALYLCVAIAMLLIIGDHHKKRDYAYIIILMLFVLLTFSKMALVTLLLLVLYFAGKSLYSIFSHKNRFVRRITVISIAAAVLFSSQIADMINSTLVRLQEHNGTAVTMDTITSNRARILQFYMGELASNPGLLLFGYGLQYNETEAYADYFYMVHNTFLDLVLSWGIFGVAMFVVIFYHIMKGIRRCRTTRFRFDEFLPLIITVTTFLALSCLSATMFWWIICAALLPLKGIESNEHATHLYYSAGVQHRKIRVRVRRVAH